MQEKFAATHQVPAPTPATSEPPTADDTVARLRDLAALHESGALDDAEFAAAKARILGLDEPGA
jgi:Short C-terminal domain